MSARERKGIMLCYPFEEKRLSKWTPPWIIQPKLDGERCRAIIGETGDAQLLSSTEEEILSVPHINLALKNLNLTQGTELDGELYIHGEPFEEIHSRVSRRVNPHDFYREIEYHIFDLVSSDPQYKRIGAIKGLEFDLPEDSPIKVVYSDLLYKADSIMPIFEAFIKDGYEGFILRNTHAPYLRKRSTYMMKFKPKKSDFYLIAGYEEEVSIKGEPKGRLGALVLKSPDLYKPGLFKVGSGFTSEQREVIWKQREDLVGKICEVKYQHLTSMGVPRFPVFIQVLKPSELVGRLGRL